MPANRFATVLRRNTNRLTLILVYAFLEWILILLLLLNALFSYLIIKFAAFFGLKPPCPWCSRLDHVFESKRKQSSLRDLLCEVHAAEVSKLGYCSNHCKLAEWQDMCEDCSSSRPDDKGVSKRFAFFPWMKRIAIQTEAEKLVEDGEESSRCSCCGVSLESRVYSPYIVIKPSWGVMDCPQTRHLITEARNEDDSNEDVVDADRRSSDCMVDRCEEEDEEEVGGKVENRHMLSEVGRGFGIREGEADEYSSVSVFNLGSKKLEGNDDDIVDVFIAAEKEPTEDNSNMSEEDPSHYNMTNHFGSREDTSLEILPQHLEFFFGHDGSELIPVELSEENQPNYTSKVQDHEAKLGSELQVEERNESIWENQCSLREEKVEISATETREQPKFSAFDSIGKEENENSFVFNARECGLMGEVYEPVFPVTPEPQTPSKDTNVIQESVQAEGKQREDSDDSPVLEEASQLPISDSEAEVSIGAEIPDLDSSDEIPTQEISHMHEDPSTSSANSHADNDHGSDQIEEGTNECKTMSIETSEQAISDHLSSLYSETREIEEDKVPETPTSMESARHLHKKMLLLERRGSGTEESLDGSVMSEFEGSEGILTIERLKTALTAERKALQALYMELEEERSASAVAASQTMAMINRLQEEKAAMQMEALQYQRMMEEQSEYDQEALQLLNELMVKREREKEELERELEIYRRKVLDYEAKEKIRGRSATSSASSSSASDSDGLSVDLNQEAKGEDSFFTHQESSNHSTPVDAVLNLEESLAKFEEEKLSIVEQLKVLEGKLFTLGDDEEQQFQGVKPIEHFYEENGKHLEYNSDFDSEPNVIANGFPKEMNGKHHQEKRILGAAGKRLLPLFDAIGAENENGALNGHDNGLDLDPNVLQYSSVTKAELENKRLVIEEDMDHLYERIQALEADREFLKHCISSLKEGDKGMDLLQEILQHLRDLRSVELRVKNLDDSALI